MWWSEEKLNRKTAHFRLSSAAQKRCMLKLSNRELKHARFWDADGKRKWAVFPYNSSSHITFTMLSTFSLLWMISIKMWETPLSWHTECSLPVAVRVSKTRVLKLPIILSRNPNYKIKYKIKSDKRSNSASCSRIICVVSLPEETLKNFNTKLARIAKQSR